MKIDPYYQRQKGASVEFSDAQIVHKFAVRVTPNPDFKGTPFDVEYLRNGNI